MGDLNYRIMGNRKIVDSMISKHMHDAMINNCQLTKQRMEGNSFTNLIEKYICFGPT